MKREINLKDDYRAYLKIREIIRDFKPDIVHTHASKPGAIGRLAAFHEKVPVVVHTFHGHVFHSYFGKAKTMFYKTIERYLASKSNSIIAISQSQADELSLEHTICSAEKIKIIPLGFDLGKFHDGKEAKRKAFREEYNLETNELVVCIVGRLVPVKNHAFLLDVIKTVNIKSKVNFRLFIVGDGEERTKIEAKARILGLSFSAEKKSKAQIIFTSWIKEVDFVYSGSDIVVLTSLNEGTPVSLIEAQAAGKPIVSTDVGGIHNIVLENETALLSAKTDVENFSNNLIRLLEDDELRKKMSEKGWDFVKENFHYTRLTQDMDNLYQNLLQISGNNQK
jgi:glycosyltransferase involved in cell wall biosynthesis